MSANNSFDVNILIEGIIVLLFERDAQGQVIACHAGAVRDVPDHVLTVSGRKLDQAGQPTDFAFNNIGSEIRLDVQGAAQPGLSFFKLDEEIDRLGGGGDQNSFAWLLDFETELYGRGIGADPTKFKSILRFANGELYTDVVSQNHLLVREEGQPSDPYTLVGKVATRIGVRLNLAEGGSASLSNGTAETITVNAGERLEAAVRLICPTDDPTRAGQPSAHANHYYNAIGKDLNWGEKKLFSSTKFMVPAGLGAAPPVSPEASCLVGSAGQSDPHG